MQISSIRCGFATNSSSWHSILYKCRKKAVGQRNDEPFEFGWDWFHLKDSKSKSHYCAAILFESLPRELPYDFKKSIIKDTIGVSIPKEKAGKWSSDIGIDHQSQICLPMSMSRDSIDVEFARDFFHYIIENPDISIGGGNDNEKNHRDRWKADRPFDNFYKTCGESQAGSSVVRKDGDWYTIFNFRTGTKVRLSFVNSPSLYVCSSTPELVDLKITDNCPYGCKFCYQDSTPKGQHADKGKIQDLMYRFSDAQLMEVAIGGGEPTLHPDFANILSTAYYSDIVPNFSTHTMDWTKNEKIVDAVCEYVGGFAISSLNIKVLSELSKWNGARKWNYSTRHYNRPKGTVQIPLGCYTKRELISALKFCDHNWIDVTFLGYKSFGRGKSIKPTDYSWLMDYIKENYWDHFGADTLFVEQFRKKLKNFTDDKLMVGREGRFSCYVDAVKGKIGPSSYCSEELMSDVPERGSEVGKGVKIFSKFPYTN